jgi:acylaminoacyl-peptidase
MKIPAFSAVLLLLAMHAIPQTSDRFEPINVFDLEYVSDPRISPDGTRVIYVRNFRDIMTDRGYSNLWIVNFDGTENRPLTTGNHNDFSPKWSRDGTRIIYKSNREGSVQIYLRWMDSGAETKLTNIRQSPGTIDWSPDDRQLAFDMFVPVESPSVIHMPQKPEGARWNDPPIYIDDLRYRADGRGYLVDGARQLFVLSTDGGTPRQLTSGENDYGAPAWSFDGKKLYFSANLKKGGEYEPYDSDIYSLEVATGKLDTLTKRYGPDMAPRPSPDGTHIAYLGFDDIHQVYQPTKLYIMDTKGEQVELVSGELDRDIRQIHWDEKGTGIYFMYDDYGNTKLAHISLNGKVKDLADNLGGLSLGRPYSGGEYSVSGDGRYSFTLTGPHFPADLATGEHSDVLRITNLNGDLFRYKELGDVEELWFNSSFDGRRIHSWIVRPPGFDPQKKYPLILEIHGGPVDNYGPRFSTEIQLYAAAGYVVLYMNPRGSDSYGEEFGNLIHLHYPGEDYDDLMSGVDTLIDMGFIDPQNLFVTGGSGGGVLTAWIIGKTDRFSAAVVAKPVINWYSMALYTDVSVFTSRYFFDGYPWDIPDSYMERSPISLVGNVSTPTMILTGEEDYRTPIAETEQLFGALKIRKVEAAMVRIPNSSHDIAGRPSNLIAKVSAILGWFDSHRRGDSEGNETE